MEIKSRSMVLSVDEGKMILQAPFPGRLDVFAQFVPLDHNGNEEEPIKGSLRRDHLMEDLQEMFHGKKVWSPKRKKKEINSFFASVIKASRELINWATPPKKFYRTVISVEVLSESPYTPVSIQQIADDTDFGDCSGSFDVVSMEEVEGPEMAELLKKQGSEPRFFLLTEDGKYDPDLGDYEFD